MAVYPFSQKIVRIQQIMMFGFDVQVFFLVAMLAACVASQAMISGAFQIIKQSINLGCFPRLTVKSASKTV